MIFLFTMVLDVVELQVLLVNHDHRLSNVWDYVMMQPKIRKIILLKKKFINRFKYTIGTSDGCSKPRLSKLIEQIASQNCGT